MSGRGRMGIVAKLRERLLRGRGEFRKGTFGEAVGGAEDAGGIARGVAKGGTVLAEAVGGAEEAGGTARGVAKGGTVLAEVVGGAEEAGGIARGVAKGGTALAEGVGGGGSALTEGEDVKAVRESGEGTSGGREYDEDGVLAYLREHGEVLERLVAELRQGAEVCDVPTLLGKGAHVVTRTPSDRPKTIADAGEMAEQYFRRRHL